MTNKLNTATVMNILTFGMKLKTAMRFTICWKIAGKVGNGQELFSLSEGLALCATLNEKWGDNTHWLI